MTSRSAIAAVAALLSATAVGAIAQTTSLSSPGAKASRATPIRIQMQTQFMLHGSGSTTLEDQRLLQENLRRAIYETAAKECELLNAVFHGECRLVSLNAGSNALDRGTGTESASGNGAATFEIIPQSD
jgi:hypothetical protein